MMFHQNQFVITSRYLIVQNIYIPGYKYRIPVAGIEAIETEINDRGANQVKIISQTKTQQFSTYIDERDLRQIAFLVGEKTREFEQSSVK